MYLSLYFQHLMHATPRKHKRCSPARGKICFSDGFQFSNCKQPPEDYPPTVWSLLSAPNEATSTSMGSREGCSIFRLVLPPSRSRVWIGSSPAIATITSCHTQSQTRRQRPPTILHYSMMMIWPAGRVDSKSHFAPIAMSASRLKQWARELKKATHGGNNTEEAFNINKHTWSHKLI